MKKAALWIGILFAAVLCVGCGTTPDKPEKDPDGTEQNGGTEGNGSGEEQSVTNELLFDKTFSQGIAVSALESQAVSYTWWKYGAASASTDPYWSLGQYCNLANTRENYDSSVNDLSLGTIFDEGKGIEGQEGNFYTLTNESGSKEIKVDPSTGTVVLNVDTSKEYINQSTGEMVPRSPGEDWVHMILSQNPGTVTLSQIEAFTMSLDFTLNVCEVYHNTDAAQFQWIFGVHDKTSAIGDYFWFNVTLFDNRYEVFPGTQMYDGGKADATGKFIYAPTGEELFGESGGKTEIGVTYHVELNLKEYMKQAFEIAQSFGAMSGCAWENLTVSSFNIGWEVTNVSRVGVTLENLSLTVTTET